VSLIRAAVVGSTLALVVSACGPIDRPLGADLDGRRYVPACRTRVPDAMLGEPIAGYELDAPDRIESDARAIPGVDIDEAFAASLPSGTCVGRDAWVLFVNDDLRPQRVDRLIGAFSGGR
jgi:hypothetical protein